MEIRRQVRVVFATLMALNLAFLFIMPIDDPWFRWIAILAAAWALVLWQLDRGRRWARRLVMIAAAISVLSILSLPPYQPSRAINLVNVVVSVAVWFWLRRPEVRAYYGVSEVRHGRRWGRILLWIGATVALVIAGMAAMVYWIYRVEQSRAVWVEPFDSDTPVLLWEEGAATSPRIDPSGARIAFVSRATAGKGSWRLVVQDRGTRTGRAVLERDHLIESLSWNPDGRRIAFIARSGYSSDVWVVSLPEGAVQRLTDDGGTKLRVRWAPDGETVGYLVEEGIGKRRLWSVDGPGEAPHPQMPDSSRHSVQSWDWSSDGGSIVFVTDQGALRELSLRAGTVRAVEVRGYPQFQQVSRVSSSPGRFFARALRPNGSHADWILVSPDSTAARVIKKGRPFFENDADVSPDGTWAVYTRPTSSKDRGRR